MLKSCLLFLSVFFALSALADKADDSVFTEEWAADDFTPAETAGQQAEVPGENDAIERWNHKVSAFNDWMDELILKPVAQGYRYITPSIVDTGVSNVFANVGELPSGLNALLQGKPLAAIDNLFRFVINTTAGVFGFFDAATAAGISRQKEDFGQTLAVWGVPRGSYLVLPFFGSSSLRDAPAMLVDMRISPLNLVEDNTVSYSLWALRMVDKRADLFEAEKMISGDRYIFLKNAYLQSRHYQENDGNVIDTFDTTEIEDDEDWLE